MSQERFRWEVDPQALEASLRELVERAKRLVAEGRYTRVRLKYRGKPMGPEVPLPALIAMEGLGLLVASPLYLLIANLGVKAFVEVEFIHEAEDRIREGMDLFNDGEVDEAEKKYREALALRHDDPLASYHLGVLLRVTGRREEAIACLERAAKSEIPEAEKAREARSKMSRTGRSL